MHTISAPAIVVRIINVSHFATFLEDEFSILAGSSRVYTAFIVSTT